MAGNSQHIKGKFQPSGAIKPFVTSQRYVAVGERFGSRSIDACACSAYQLSHTASMVTMVVGDHDSVQPNAMAI